MRFDTVFRPIWCDLALYRGHGLWFDTVFRCQDTESNRTRGPSEYSCKSEMVFTRERAKRPTSSVVDQAEVTKRTQRSSARGASTTELPAANAPKPVRSNEPQPPSDSRRSAGARTQSGKVLACFPHRPH